MSLEQLKFGVRDTNPSQQRCPGCGVLVSKAFGVYGKLYTTVGFTDKVKETTLYNMETQKLETIVETVTVPIKNYVHGLICESCQTYKTRTTRTGKWHYLFIPDSNPRSQTSVNPGYSRYNEYERSKPESKPIRYSSDIEGGGMLVFDLVTGDTEQEKG